MACHSQTFTWYEPHQHNISWSRSSSDPSNSGTALRNYVFDDEHTSMDEWYDVVEACQRQDKPNVALDVLAAATVITSIRGATHYMEQIERQRAEEARRRQEEELRQKEAKGKKRKRRRYAREENDKTPNFDSSKDIRDTEAGIEPVWCIRIRCQCYLVGFWCSSLGVSNLLYYMYAEVVNMPMLMRYLIFGGQ